MARAPRPADAPRRVLVVDIGGSHIKILATGRRERRITDSGPALTPSGAVAAVQELAGDWTLCAHHFLPFFGVAHVGYIPANRLVGLSKLARVVDFYGRRPQLQERLTEQIAGFLEQRVAPVGVILSLEARHLCMEMRGVSRPGVTTTTTAVRGSFGDERLQRRFFTQLRGRATEPGREEK